jgi:hypothetical protein
MCYNVGTIKHKEVTDMAGKKEYTVICHHRGRATEYTGTLEYLIKDVFGYTLEAGAS